MGRHANEQRGRIFAPWVITTAIVVLVVVAATVGYLVIMVRANSDEAGVCKSAVSLPVAAGPSAARALTEAATAYNATHPVVRSACITVSVTAAADSDAITGFTDRWSPRNGPRPGMWVPSDAASLAALDALRPELTAGHPTDPFAWSPVVLATAADRADAIGALSWSDLLDGADQGNDLTLVLGPVLTTRAVSYALQSTLAAPEGTHPVSSGTIELHAETLRATVADAQQAAGTSDALARLVDEGTDGTELAVPVVEADLAQYLQRDPADLAAVYPQGATVGDALIGAPISAPWTDRTVTAAASDFLAFLSSVDGQQILADGGWRTVSAHPSDPPRGVDLQAAVTMIPTGGPEVDRALAVAVGEATPAPTTSSPVPSTTTTSPTTETETTPSTTTPTTTEETAPSTQLNTDGPILTLIIDTSEGMADEDRGASLMSWVKKALPELLDGSVSDRVGLWVYSDGGVYPPTGSPELVPVGIITKKTTVTSPVDGSTSKTVRSTGLNDVIQDLTPDGERWAYGALMEALPKAADAAKKNRDSRALLITSGADQTPGTLRRQVLDAVRATADSVRLDVVGVGSAVPVDAYTDIAAAGGGEYVPVVNPKKLGQQLVEFLTLDE